LPATWPISCVTRSPRATWAKFHHVLRPTGRLILVRPAAPGRAVRLVACDGPDRPCLRKNA
jgi:hypothetical protein